MPGPPPPPFGQESPKARERRLRREARAERLGTDTKALYMLERLESVQRELAELPEEEREAACAKHHANREGFLELCHQNHMDYTMEEYQRVSAEAAQLAEAKADVAAFLALDEAGLLDLVQRHRMCE